MPINRNLWQVLKERGRNPPRESASKVGDLDPLSSRQSCIAPVARRCGVAHSSVFSMSANTPISLSSTRIHVKNRPGFKWLRLLACVVQPDASGAAALGRVIPVRETSIVAAIAVGATENVSKSRTRDIKEAQPRT
jgi:hypothetical protein